MSAEKEDARFEWLETKILTSLKVKIEKIKKLTSTPETRGIVQDFYDANDPKTLFVYLTSKDDLVADVTAPNPATLKKKSLSIFKKHGQATISNFRNQCVCVEMSASVLETFLYVAQDIFYPILTNPMNQGGWPDVMAKKISQSLHKFLSNLYITLGQTKGKTLLPLPPGQDTIPVEKAAHDKDRVHSLESAVVTWTRQIKNILKQDPENHLQNSQSMGPQMEIEFWQKKARDLNSIHEQLISAKIRKVVKILEITKSTYFPAFNRLCKEVAYSRMEANDNVIFLQPLEKYFNLLSQESFTRIHAIFKPMSHTILLIWKNSKYYNTAVRLVVLMRQISNHVISQACKFISGETIFSMEPQEAVEALATCIKVCITFKDVYLKYQAKSQIECPGSPWKFQNSALFARLDSFLERCHDVLDLMQTTVQFNKLEKIEIGGTKGKSLTTSVRQSYIDFTEAIKIFKNATYDVMDVEAKQFDDDFFIFRTRISELERRVASVIIQAFDDSTTVLGRFKLLDSFEGLLEREIIQTDLERKNSDLITAFCNDLKQVQEIFLLGKASPPLGDNMPPRAGAVSWVRGLIERIQDPMQRLKQMGKGVLESEEGKEATRMFSVIMATLEDYEKQHVEEWSQQIENTSQEKLKQFLLRRDDDSLFLRVNFDPELVCLLREVKYFMLLNIQVPESAMQIYSKAETFRQQTGNLELIVNTYNNMLATLLEVEKPLLQNKLENIDKSLQKGLKHLNWKSHSIPEFISQTMSVVKEASTVLSTIKKNVKDSSKILQLWVDNLLFDRKTVKTYTVEEFGQTHTALITQRYNEVRDGAEQISNHISNSGKVLKVSKGATAWKAYVDYVNQIVIDGICQAVLVSEKFLKNQLDPAYLLANDINPLLEIKLELVTPDICFVPDLEFNAKGDGVRDLVSGWINSIVNIGTLIKRLDTGDGDYLNDIQDDLDVKWITSAINRLVNEMEANCMNFRESFMSYSYLWQEDINGLFKEFLETETRPGKDIPPLPKFEEKIKRYRDLEDEIKELTASKTFGWIRVDAKPIKQALYSWACRWTFAYKQYLLDKVTKTTEDLISFMSSSDLTMDKDIKSDDHDQCSR